MLPVASDDGQMKNAGNDDFDKFDEQIAFYLSFGQRSTEFLFIAKSLGFFSK